MSISNRYDKLRTNPTTSDANSYRSTCVQKTMLRERVDNLLVNIRFNPNQSTTFTPTHIITNIEGSVSCGQIELMLQMVQCIHVVDTDQTS